MSVVDPPPLAWLAEALWPDGGAELVAGPADAATRWAWWAAPNAAEAHFLAPATQPHIRAAVRRYHDGRSMLDRAKTMAVELVARTGPVARHILGRHLVTARVHRDGILEALAERFDDLDQVAVSLSHPKTNRKPVLQLIDRGGRTFGFAKVAVSDHTASLLANEATWLRSAAHAAVLAPVVLDETTLCGRRVLVTSAVVGSRLPGRHRHRCPLDLVSDVAALGTLDRRRVGELPWTARVRGLLDHATEAERAAIDTTLERHGDQVVTEAAWHGDLTPWNVMRDRRGPALIDWEFAADGVPMGFDVCHFHTQVAMELAGRDAHDAMAATFASAPTDLVTAGVDRGTIAATLDLYAVELIRRTLALRAAGLDTSAVRQGPAALRVLTRGMAA